MQKILSDIEKLKMRLSCEDFNSLSLPPFTRCKISSLLPKSLTFCSFSELAFGVFDKALLYKYKDFSLNTQKKLIFFTWVIPSGLGDLSMQIHIANMIKTIHPELPIELISIVHETSFIPEPLKSTLPHHIIRYNHPHPPTFSSEITSLLREAFSVIEIPTAYFDFPSLKKLIQQDNTTPPIISRIGQYGFIGTEDYHPSTKERSMGLHFLEKGVIVLESVPPQKRNLDSYFAYLITKNGMLTYIHSILLHRMKDQKDLTLLIPNIDRLLPILQEIDFTSYGIKNIVIKDFPHISLLDYNKKGKTISIEHVKNLHPKEVLHYMSTSNPFVGIRGDGSFTECLSTDALFFYDALDHALPFLTDLTYIAQNELMPYYSLGEYLLHLVNTKADPYKRAKAIAELLDDPSLYYGMEKLGTLLKTYYRCNETLDHIIRQNFAFYQDPSLKEREEALFRDFIDQKIPFSEVYKKR